MAATIVTWKGKYPLDFGELPETVGKVPLSTLIALVNRGRGHVHSNEVSSRAGTALRKRLAEEIKASTGKDAEKAAIDAAYEHVSDADFEAECDVQREKLYAAELAGELGTGAARKDPVEKEYDAILVSEITKTLKANKLDMPKAWDDTVKFGNGAVMTKRELFDRREARFGDEYRARAEKKVADDAKKLAKAKAEAEAKAAAGPVSAEDLGF